MSQAILSLLVSNSFGVLSKVTGLFSRRGYNIKTLSVGETENPEYSRITITTQGNGHKLEQIYRQVLKLEDVKQAELLPSDNIVQRELVLIKVKPAPGQEGELNGLKDSFGLKILEAPDCYILELTAPASRVDVLIQQARALNILEMSRTGVTALILCGDPLSLQKSE